MHALYLPIQGCLFANESANYVNTPSFCKKRDVIYNTPPFSERGRIGRIQPPFRGRIGAIPYLKKSRIAKSKTIHESCTSQSNTTPKAECWIVPTT